jgi:hypothetical protein
LLNVVVATCKKRWKFLVRVVPERNDWVVRFRSHSFEKTRDETSAMGTPSMGGVPMAEVSTCVFFRDKRTKTDESIVPFWNLRKNVCDYSTHHVFLEWRVRSQT